MPTPPSERNLLFAVLALQNELAKPDDVLAAMQAWVAAKHRPLGELLVERGALDSEHRRLLDALIEAQLARHGTAEQSLVALDPSNRARRLLAKIADPDVQASLAALPANSGPETTLDYRPTEAGPRYRVLRPHAEGGLGEVFVAEDQELHREVALKEIKREHAQRADSRSRFLLEAEITGGLEHPGIVPVYGLGTYGDGRPFYAMRFIKGDNLKAAIQRFHSAEPVRFDSLEFRQLLGRFVDVCQAVGYAHSRGVLHRDLKPGNIMLGKFGETLVVDWGLAKVVGRNDGDGRGTREEATLRPSSGSLYAETMAGSAIGTPAFMSPEQAEGKVDELGPATDVYSLGATLYMVLANKPPFEGNVAEVLEQVRQGSWAPPRTVNPQVPAGLDAICRKAMALRPEDRYGSPLELAEEVEHWLADEPVSAYREPAVVRVRRWLRQRPKRVTAAGVLLLATVVGLMVGTVLIDQQRQVAQENFEEAERQRQVANRMFQKAKDAVDTYFTRVSQDQLLRQGRMKPLRKDLLTLALRYYEGFIEEGKNDPAMRRELAKACFRASEINLVIGMNAVGQAQAARGDKLYEEMLAHSPGDKDLREELAAAHFMLSAAQYHAGQEKAALGSVSRVIELLEPLWAEDPSNVTTALSLASAYAWRNLQRKDGSLLEETAADTRRALEILEKALATGATEERDRILDTLAGTYYRCGGLPGCLRAIKIYRELLGDAPKKHPLLVERKRGESPYLRPIWGGGLASNVSLRGPLYNAGYLLICFGQPRKAEPLLREAEAIVRRDVRENPEDDGPMLYLDWPLGWLGESLLAQGKTRCARSALQEAVALKEDLQRRGVALGGNWLDNHARYTYLLGRLECESGEFAGGLGHCEAALAEMEEIRTAENGLGKDNPMVHSDSLWIHEALARFRFLAGKNSREERLSEQRRILAARKSLFNRVPKSAEWEAQYELEVGASAAVLADCLVEAGRMDEALNVVNEVLPGHQRWVENDKPGNREFHGYDLRNCFARKWLAELLARKGEALARSGKPADAAKAVHRAIEICEDIAQQEPCYLYDLADHLTLASTLPGSAGVTNPADRAIKALRGYIASGFDNPYKLRTDPRLEPLRKREDFQKLVRDLEIKVKATKGPK
ncbi:MAG: protein kinase domain-containing protein [Thermoguttaceae bacterium]